MLSNLIKTSAITFVFAFIISAKSFAQEKMDSTMNHKNMKMQNMEVMKDSSHKKTDKKNSIVREGVIDLQSIDKNKDGKVFQDMMDYNVISDKPGKCPLCGMKLKEVSLKKAKNALIKSGFKVKE